MNRELLKPIIRAMVALVLIVLIKLAAMATLRGIDTYYLAVNTALSLAVIAVLLKFRQEFNHQLGIFSPHVPEAQSIASGLVYLLVVLTLYGTFLPFSDALQYGLYNLIFFFLSLVPIFTLWKVLYKHTDRLSDLLTIIQDENVRACSCGWKNPPSSRFCGRCGMLLQEKIL